MAVMAPVTGFSLAALERFSAGLALPQAAAPSTKQPKLPDVVVFSSAPTRILSDLASAGLRQLATLLPMLERAVQNGEAAPLGQLAKAAGAAARQIGDGHEALLAEGPDRIAASMQPEASAPTSAPPSASSDSKQSLRTLARQLGAEAPADPGRATEPAPALRNETPPPAVADAKQLLRTLARQIGAEMEPAKNGRALIVDLDPPEPRARAEPDAGPVQRWISEARHLLRDTGDVLERAEEQLRPSASMESGILAGAAPTSWILSEIAAAQAQIATAYASVGRARTTARVSYRSTPRTLPLDHLANATTLLGMALILATLWILGGVWSAATGVVALCGAALWVWRISAASKGVTLDARR